MQVKVAELLAYAEPTGTKAKRSQLQIHLEYDVDGAVEYEWLGDDATESSITLELDETTETNIKDVSTYTVNSVTMSQEMSPFFVKSGSRTHQVILSIIRDKAWDKLSQFTAILVQGYVKLDDKTYAERHVNCGLAIGDIGGATGGVDIPVTITYSNDKTLGYWEENATTKKMEFKPQVVTP